MNDESDEDSLSMDSDETQNVKTGYAIKEESNDGSEEQSVLCKIQIDDELVEKSEYNFDIENSSGSELEQESSPEQITEDDNYEMRLPHFRSSYPQNSQSAFVFNNPSRAFGHIPQIRDLSGVFADVGLESSISLSDESNDEMDNEQNNLDENQLSEDSFEVEQRPRLPLWLPRRNELPRIHIDD